MVTTSLMYACKIDNNHSEIVWELKQLGCSVQDLSNVGNGCPDIIVGYRNKNYFLEIKTDKGKLNKRQERYHSLWLGQIAVVRSIDDCISIIDGLQKP